MRILIVLSLFVALAGAKARPRDSWFAVSVPAKAKVRVGYRDADWRKLRRLLVSKIAPEADKRKWTVAFLVAYWRAPGVEPAMAKILVRHVPPCKMREALKALAQGRKSAPAVASSADLPGFEQADATPAKPEAPDPLEALLVARAKDYAAKRAAIQDKQLALLQGSEQDSAEVRRELTQDLPPLQKKLCEASAQYLEKFGPLELKGLLAKENLLEPFDSARCP
jgi:hypothetical protein